MNERGDRQPRLLAYVFLIQGVISLTTGLIAIGFVAFGPIEQRPLAFAWAVTGIGTGGAMLLVRRGILAAWRGR